MFNFGRFVVLIRSKRSAQIALGSTALLLGCAIYAGSKTGEPERYGPYVCSSCSLGRPIPDLATQAYIDSIDESLNGVWSLGDINDGYRAVGDVFIVCNATACVDYTRTNSMDFDGDNPRSRETSTGGGGGGGNEGGGGNYGGGGGCVASCGGGTGGTGGSGTVIVREPVPTNDV